MSLSCRKSIAALAFALAGSSAAWAQQNFFVPSFETSAEYNTNWEMVPKEERDAMASYRADLQARLGRRTQRTTLELRPRVSFQEYPDRKGVDPTEYFLDLRTSHRTERSEFKVVGRFARRDAFNAEYGTATFNELNPELSTVNDTGIIFVGATRTSWDFEPQWTYKASERNGFGARFDLSSARYHPMEVIDRSGFDNGVAEIFFLRQIAQLTRLEIGPYGGKFKAADGSNDTDIRGLSALLHHDWSTISFVEVSANVEQDDTTSKDDLGVVTQDKSTAWGIEVTGYRRNRVGGLRYTIGRTIDPSSFGDRRTIDQVRVQWERPLSPLAAFVAAVRYTHETPVGNTVAARRDRVFSELMLRKQFTPLFYVMGGYRFAFQDVETTGSFQNHGVFLTFGFRARDPERMR